MNPEIPVKKTYEEINDKIKQGKAVIVTADEMPSIVSSEGVKSAFKKVDVVTTGTFGIMCSSGAFLNFPHPKPKIKASKVRINEVEAYGGLAAADFFIGATQVSEDDPLNKVYPGRFRYGGGHVIEDLVSRRNVMLKAEGYTTDCYPLDKYEAVMTIDDFRDAILFNPRNSYQNYNCAVNSTKKTIYTYMGILKPDMANVTFSSAGVLSPLLNDPYYWTVGPGVKIFLGGAAGSVAWNGTQHEPDTHRGENGIPRASAGTLSVIGNLKEMSHEFIRGVSITGYGCSLMVGIGVPIPIINEEMAYFTGQSDSDLKCQVVDYGYDYPNGENCSVSEVSYAELKSGKIRINGKEVHASPLSSYPGAKKIARSLKHWIENGFEIGPPNQSIPTVQSKVRFD